MPKWECVKCGEVHRSNPEKCSACSHTILIQHRRSGLLSSLKPYLSRPSRSESADQYYCKKCGHVHDRKPFVCEECGASTLAPYDIPPVLMEEEGQPPVEESPSIAPVVAGLILMLVMVAIFMWMFL